MKVLIADKFQPSGVQQLKDLRFEVEYQPDVPAESLAEAVAKSDPHVLVVRSKKAPAAVFERAGRLSLVVRAGAGYDTIDVAAASARGIYVSNCPGKNAIAVAELVWGLILGCDRRIADQTGELRRGAWNKKEYSKARGLAGRTLGVVGVGTIGAEVIRRGKAFGMDTIAWSRSLNEAKARELGVTAMPSPPALARHADVISVNVAATAETKGLVNAEFCEAMKPGTIFVNTSRGSVVDERALLKAMNEKKVRAGLDVFQNEPAADGEFRSELASHALCTGTHHIGASTDQAQDAIADETVRIIAAYKRTGEVPNCVNRCEKSPATRLLVVRHLNRPGVLAHVVGEIGRANINIEEMENVIYQGATAATAKIRLDQQPPADVLERIARGSPHVLSADVNAIE
ncbi:MAG: hydroxyacid dehydrogenase [Phycisphaerales bacterium]|nr:hydroxyacid dehydrogenase [Phycisphaerales bacterium]